MLGPVHQLDSSIKLPSTREIGDSNRDGRFDVKDIVQILIANKYNTGQPATWEEGDWNGDGLFNLFDIILALQAGTFGANPATEAAVLAESPTKQTSIGSTAAFDYYHRQEEATLSEESLNVEPEILDSINLLATQRRSRAR